MAKKVDDNLFDLPYDTPDEAELFNKRPSQSVDAADIFTEPFEPSGEYLAGVDNELDAGAAYPQTKTHSRFSMTQVFLLSAILFVGASLLYLMSGYAGPKDSMAHGDNPPNVPAMVPIPPVTPTSMVPVTSKEPNEPAEDAVVYNVDPDGPVSLLVAERAYQNIDLERAFALYERLLEDLPAGRDNESAAAFMRLRMAFCLKGLGRVEAAGTLMRQLNQGHYPLIQAIIRYHQCVDNLREGQSYSAIQRAYQALSLADCVEENPAWREQFKQSCVFLVGQSLTTEALANYRAEGQWPVTLWDQAAYVDPFLGLDQFAIIRLVESGTEAFRLAQVGPQIERTPGDIDGQSWRVVCNGASVDQLLRRFASNSFLDLDWSYTLEAGLEIVDDVVRQRPVKLFLQDLSPQEVAVRAAGCAQLFADLADSGVIRITDPKPEKYRSLSRLQESLTREALVHWQRVTLSGKVLPYTANAHFASALLLEYSQQTSEAITEYQLLASRFKQSDLAPRALMRSSQLRMNMMDFQGAREDLKHLVELHPDAGFKAEAYLRLASATWKAGLAGEAVIHFRSVYYMDDATLANRAAAAMGAAQCHFQRQEYLESARWLSWYIDAALRDPSIDPAEGFLLMGRALSALGKYNEAGNALERALAGGLDKAQYLEGLGYLVNLDTLQGRPVDALNLLERDVAWELSRGEINEIESLKAEVLFSMGLQEKALAVLEDRLPFLSEARQRGKIYFQMAQYYEASGEMNKALAFYGDVIDTVEPGLISNEARLGLARISLHDEKYQQAVTLLEGLLADGPEETIRSTAQQYLVQAYKNNHELDKATQILLQQRLSRPNGPTDPNTMSSDAMPDQPAALNEA